MKLSIALQGMTVYQFILERPIVHQICELFYALDESSGRQALTAYTKAYSLLRQAGFSSLYNYILDLLQFEDSPYATAIARGDKPDAMLTQAASTDIATLANLALFPCDDLKKQLSFLLPSEYQSLVTALPSWDALEQERNEQGIDLDHLTAFYQKNGSGVFARYRAFVWENGKLIPVAEPDVLPLSSFVGYEEERQEVIHNTQGLIKGLHVNDILLYGDSGTGKSATVRALLSADGFDNLRIVQVRRSLDQIPALIHLLGHRQQKFILFIDDLSFEDSDPMYSALKTILEGSMEKRPNNIVIYATSNRRHLVKQYFSDRENELSPGETIQEKTSLSERFGLRIAFLSLNQADFLSLVDQLAAQAGLLTKENENDTPAIELTELHTKALQWELRHPGRTPRSARQFIASLMI